ncbi:MAG: sulfurtransferase TusA family protein [Chloroflexota bacterium]|nr:sulfurtransferase TusA family protein [Chloroflexota bacterium]
MMTEVDARGLSCPMPVIKTKKALDSVESGEEVLVILNDATARDNVTRLAKSRKCTISEAVQGDEYHLTLVKG